MRAELNLACFYVLNDGGASRITCRKKVEINRSTDLPWSASTVRCNTSCKRSVVHFLDAGGPCGIEVMVHTKRPEAGIAADRKWLAGCPDQAAPENVIYAHHEAEAVGLKVIERAEVDRAAESKCGGKNKGITTELSDDRSRGVLQDRGSGGLRIAVLVRMEAVNEVAAEFQRRFPLQGGDVMGRRTSG